MDGSFRFALQSLPQDAGQWRAAAQRAEELGYATVLMPDGMQLPAPLPALAIAAGATASLHVGTYVLASPLRAPRLAAWDAHSLSLLSGGRFELGLGTGNARVLRQATELLGQPPMSGPERLARVEQTVDELRALDGERHHTPVLMAAGGPRARALAGAKADIFVLAVGPLTSRDEVARLAAEVRAAAGDRAGTLEFGTTVFMVGDELPPGLGQFLRLDEVTLIEHDSLAVLRGTPQQMADELRRRRDTLGCSYVIVNAAFRDQFAPVVELLAGR